MNPSAPRRRDKAADPKPERQGAEAQPERQGAEAQRTCVGCRRTGAQRDLTRIARRPDGTVAVGRTVPGRGAYVCSPACFERAVQRTTLARALRTELPRGEIDRLRATLFGNNQ